MLFSLLWIHVLEKTPEISGRAPWCLGGKTNYSEWSGDARTFLEGADPRSGSEGWVGGNVWEALLCKMLRLCFCWEPRRRSLPRGPKGGAGGERTGFLSSLAVAALCKLGLAVGDAATKLSSLTYKWWIWGMADTTWQHLHTSCNIEIMIRIGVRPRVANGVSCPAGTGVITIKLWHSL